MKVSAGLRQESHSSFPDSEDNEKRSHIPGVFLTGVMEVSGIKVRVAEGEFWTSKQRDGHSLHEISYRACFKPQLPHFFLEHLSRPGDWIYDPFSGRGTTAIESGLLSRNVITNDANPLSALLTIPRFFPPARDELHKRLEDIPLVPETEPDMDLSMFYDKKTFGEISAIRDYISERQKDGVYDELDGWVRMVATNRLTGHSPGFFSVYTLPPNQAVSQERQKIINEKLQQSPQYRDTHKILEKKSARLISDLKPGEKLRLSEIGRKGIFLTGDARTTPQIDDESVSLTITSPPFLNIVQYSKDNWLRCWFNGIDGEKVAGWLTLTPTVSKWEEVMGSVFKELYRITKPEGHVAFEVGEVRKGSVKLDEHVIPLALSAGFECSLVLVQTQNFTKTAHIWGISNNTGGTNTNRIVLLQKN